MKPAWQSAPSHRSHTIARPTRRTTAGLPCLRTAPPSAAPPQQQASRSSRARSRWCSAAAARPPDGQQPPAPAASAAPASAAAPLPAAAQPGARWELVGQLAVAGGALDVVRLEGDRMVRVWMPPGYRREEALKNQLPLLLLHDGQNLFQDSLSFSGHSWRVAEAAAALIAAGRVPRFLVAGIDHSGAQRSLDYLPYPPGSGPGGFRLDAKDWPGGGVAAYMELVVTQVLPWLSQAYGAATDPARLALGGSSFGGICTLWACMAYPGRFGAALVESPSLWVAQERFLREDLPRYAGPWPQHMHLAMGSREYRGIRDVPGSLEWDAMLVRECQELAELLRGRGLDAGLLHHQIEEGAAHNEAAWARRLPEALLFLLAPWQEGAAASAGGSS